MGASIFSAMKTFFEEKEIPLSENLVSCAIDGVMSMIRRHKGFISRFKKLCLQLYTLCTTKP